MPDHKVDLKLLDLSSQKNGNSADDHRGNSEGSQALFGRRFRPKYTAVNIVSKRASHRHEKSTEGAHEGGERSGAGDTAHDGAEMGDAFVEEARKLQHDAFGAFTAGEAVQLGHEIAAEHAEHRGENVEDAYEDHNPHGSALGGDSVGIGIETDQNVGQSSSSANEGDDEGIGIEKRIRALFFAGDAGAGGSFRSERPKGRDPRGVLRRFFWKRLADGFDGRCAGLSVVKGKVFAVVTINAHQDEHWNGDREHFGPVLESLNEGDAFHAAERDVERDDCADNDNAGPVGQAWKNVGKSCAGAFHLGHGVEEADEEDEADRDFTK